MADKNIVELKIDVEFLDRERVKIIETLEQILKRLDDMDDEIRTKNLIVSEKTTTRDLEVTNQVVEDLELAKDLTVAGKTTTNDLEVAGVLEVTGDLEVGWGVGCVWIAAPALCHRGGGAWGRSSQRQCGWP